MITKNRLLKTVLFSLTFVFVCCTTPLKTKESKQWYKGNLHTHSYWSDGDEYPEVILDWYKKRDYQFMALSDHNTVSESDKWITVSEDSLYQSTYQNYLKNYGKNG